MENCNCSNNQVGVFLGGLLLGSFVGAVAALLLAPQSGQETRDAIEEISLETRDGVITTAKEFRNKADATYQGAVKKAKKILAPEKAAVAK